MERLLRWLEVKTVDLFARRLLLNRYDFIQVRTYKDVPVYAPADEYCREVVFAYAYAFASGEGIFVEYKSYARDIALMEHEHQHVQQLRDWGILYPALYYWQHFSQGYEENYFEVEAEAAEASIKRKR